MSKVFKLVLTALWKFLSPNNSRYFPRSRVDSRRPPLSSPLIRAAHLVDRARHHSVPRGDFFFLPGGEFFGPCIYSWPPEHADISFFGVLLLVCLSWLWSESGKWLGALLSLVVPHSSRLVQVMCTRTGSAQGSTCFALHNTRACESTAVTDCQKKVWPAGAALTALLFTHYLVL